MTEQTHAADASTEPAVGETRLFRVFLSSTFADLAAERDAVHEHVVPRLERLCAQRGAQFQLVDLRWGVSQEAALDQQAVAICLEEIARSQRLTPRPNFVLLLGERYGWRPLPPWIPAAEMEAILPRLDPDSRDLVESWYVEDRNAVPPEYLLRPREGVYEADDAWQPCEVGMHDALAAGAAGLDPRARRRYDASVTEQEAVAGILETPDAPEHVHCFFRSLVDVPDDEAGRAFRDAGERRARLVRFKAELRAFLGDERVHEYECRWVDGKPADTHLPALCDDVYDAIAGTIAAELARAGARDAREVEDAHHVSFGRERRRHFVGRLGPLAVVARYVAGGDGASPLLVVGASGVGKTAFMARAAADVEAAHPEAAVVLRFVGATGRSADLRTLLQDLLTELRSARDGAGEDVPAGTGDLVDAVREELVRDRPRPVVLVVDALDQLAAGARAVDLRWVAPELGAGMRMVVSAVDGPVADQLRRRLSPGALVTIDPMPGSEAAALLDAWLDDGGRTREQRRTLQPHQREEVLRSFAVQGLPLHLRLAFEEARRWPSYAPVERTILADTVPGIIRDLFARLRRKEHGELLVARSLSYLAATRNGLSERELLDLLSADEAVRSEARRRAPRSPEVARLPDILWSRLYSDLAPYLNERRADGGLLLGYYHRQLAEVVEQDHLAGDDGRERHGALATYFQAQELEIDGPSGSVANLRKLSELPFQQTHAARWNDLFATLTDFAFLERKVAAFEVEEHRRGDGEVTSTYPGVFLLQDDYELALRHWPSSGP